MTARRSLWHGVNDHSVRTSRGHQTTVGETPTAATTNNPAHVFGRRRTYGFNAGSPAR